MEATEWNFKQFKQLSEENERLKEEMKIKVEYYENKQESMQKSIDDWFNETERQAKRIEELETAIIEAEPAITAQHDRIKKLEGLLKEILPDLDEDSNWILRIKAALNL